MSLLFGSGSLSRADRRQQRAREEIGLALQLAAQDDGEYVSAVLGRRARGQHRHHRPSTNQPVSLEGMESDRLEAPAPLLATFVMDTPQRCGDTDARPLMMAETTLNPSVIHAGVVTATRTSCR